MSGVPGWGPPTAAGGAAGIDTARVQIQEAIRVRPETDRILSAAWVFVPILAVLIAIVLSILALSFVLVDPLTYSVILVAIIFVPTIIYAILIYYLITRMNEHFKRESMLRRGIIQYLRERSAQQGTGHMVAAEIATMESVHAEADANDDRKGALLWTILSVFVPFVSLYVLYFLNRYPYPHDARWRAFSQQAQAAGSRLGLVTVAPTWKALDKRSFAVYLILTIITFGIFGIFWYYVLIKDPNEHFRAHIQFEDVFASAAGASGQSPWMGAAPGPAAAPVLPPPPAYTAPPPPPAAAMELRCKSCGAPLGAGTVFCTNCGTKVA